MTAKLSVSFSVMGVAARAGPGTSARVADSTALRRNSLLAEVWPGLSFTTIADDLEIQYAQRAKVAKLRLENIAVARDILEAKFRSICRFQPTATQQKERPKSIFVLCLLTMNSMFAARPRCPNTVLLQYSLI